MLEAKNMQKEQELSTLQICLPHVQLKGLDQEKGVSSLGKSTTKPKVHRLEEDRRLQCEF